MVFSEASNAQKQFLPCKLLVLLHQRGQQSLWYKAFYCKSINQLGSQNQPGRLWGLPWTYDSHPDNVDDSAPTQVATCHIDAPSILNCPAVNLNCKAS
jgi:hypothetical protein